jgi:uncharacterized cupredoxin-like copper-binding protein
MSFSPQTHDLYVCGLNEPLTLKKATPPVTPAPSGGYRFGSMLGVAEGVPGTGTFTAMDVTTNKIAWQAKWAQTCVGGSVATAGGLVFTGESNGNFDAYDAKTGDRLWQFQTGAGVNAPAVTYEVDGVQYVAVAAGGNMQEDSPRGDSVWAFSLQGSLGPAPAPAIAPPAPSTPAAVVATSVSTTVAPITSAAAAAVATPGAVQTAPTITMYDIGFQPNAFTIPANTDVHVTLRNVGEIEHNFSIDKLKLYVTLEPGDTKAVTINAPAGTYSYYCNIDDHATAGMTGTMFVK